MSKISQETAFYRHQKSPPTNIIIKACPEQNVVVVPELQVVDLVEDVPAVADVIAVLVAGARVGKVVQEPGRAPSPVPQLPVPV